MLIICKRLLSISEITLWVQFFYKMELLGKIIKETTKVGYKIQQRRLKEFNLQQQTLNYLLTRAQDTKFGQQFRFKAMLKQDDVELAFKTLIPITDYNSFFENWLSKSIEGQKNVVWPGKTKFYALSSGTTNSPSKQIPVTDETLKQFHKSTVKQVLGLHHINPPASFYDSQVLIVGGSTKLQKKEFHKEGDLSGILAKNKSKILSPFTKPGKKISQIADWNEKVDAIVQKAPKWDVGTIAGVPSWILLLLQEIIKVHKLDTIHDIWPNLLIYSHGGIYLEPYQKDLEKCFGKKMLYQNTFLASEGYFAFQKDLYEYGMDVLLDSGVYFEFVEKQYFEQLANKDFENIKTLNLHEVRKGEDYALVISTVAGLWRYSLGDIIRFIDEDCRKIEIVGRVTFTLSRFGEHVSHDNMKMAINWIRKELRLNISEFCIHYDANKNRHIWYISVENPKKVIDSQIADMIDEKLCALNADYEYQRKYVLEKPFVKAVQSKKFYEFMERCNKIGGQSKFPRVLKGEQIGLWKEVVGSDSRL